MKKLITAVLCILVLSGLSAPVSADDLYRQNYDEYIGDIFGSLLDGETKQRLDENGLLPENENWTDSLSAGGVFSFIVSLVKGDIKRPFIALLGISAIVLVFAAFLSFSSEKHAAAATAAAVATAALIVTADVYACVRAAAEAIRASSAFMIGFVPAFASLIAVSGRAATGAASSATLLLAANAVSSFASWGVLPLMGGYLGVSISSGISPLAGKTDPAALIKKVTMWVLSLVTTVFLGVLSVQTAVSSAADAVTLKTAKFVLGTSVPVAGGVLSEAVTAVASSLGLLKSSAGIYAVVALATVMLPVIVDIILWRLCFAVSSLVASLFGADKISTLLKAVDSVLACVLGMAALCSALFIISLTVLVTASRAV